MRLKHQPQKMKMAMRPPRRMLAAHLSFRPFRANEDEADHRATPNPTGIPRSLELQMKAPSLVHPEEEEDDHLAQAAGEED